MNVEQKYFHETLKKKVLVEAPKEKVEAPKKKVFNRYQSPQMTEVSGYRQ